MVGVLVELVLDELLRPPAGVRGGIRDGHDLRAFEEREVADVLVAHHARPDDSVADDVGHAAPDVSGPWSSSGRT